MLSVSGLRGLIGQSLTPPVAARFGAAFGSWVKTQSKNAAPRVVVGRDSRPSGQMIELAACAGLVSVGCEVIAIGIATTPTTAVMVDHLKAAGGMVITASHNPIIWNGLKCLRHDGVAPPPAEANEIIRRFKEDDASHVEVEALKAMHRDESSSRVHVDRILPLIDVVAIRKAKLRCVLDSVHGAGGPATARLLRELGVECVHLYGEPTGFFPHTPEPTRENLTELAEAVARHKAHVGFAQDPDSDRLAMVDERGTYIGEEYTLALCVMHVLGKGTEGRRDGGTKGTKVAANLSTSRMIDDVAAMFGASVVRTPVGEANVAAAMKKHASPVGGEGNGGIIIPPVTYVRDSLTGIALALEMLADRGKPLSAIVDEIPRYAIVKDKLPFDPVVQERLVPSLKSAFSQQKIDLQDGVRIDWPDRWVHARPSNTEPIMRIIAEAPKESDAKELIAKVRAALGV